MVWRDELIVIRGTNSIQYGSDDTDLLCVENRCVTIFLLVGHVYLLSLRLLLPFHGSLARLNT